jgi:hypothetical protein
MSEYFKSLWPHKKSHFLPPNPNEKVEYDEADLSEIWFAGGCFWGVQAYFARIYGVAGTFAGYANGKMENTAHTQKLFILSMIRIGLRLSHFWNIYSKS